MTRPLSMIAFITGLVVIAFMAFSVIAGDSLTLLVMLLITAAFVVGGIELQGFQRDTRALQAALSDAPAGLEASECTETALQNWLGRIPVSLRQPVHQRLTGEYSALPAPVLTPYLVGLLVMLGLMGTFVGMVATLGGAVQALEGGTELSAIRDGLAAPIEGLGMAFGTSVAGVAASAMLGLIATLSRRDRLQAARELERLRDGSFRVFSLVHQRQETYRALQQQATALPAVANTLVELSERLGQLGEHISTANERSGEQLLSQQQVFEAGVRADFAQLTASLASTLENTLSGAGQQAAEMLQPQVSALLEQAAAQQSEVLSSQSAAIAGLHEQLLAQHATQTEAQQQADSQWHSAMVERTDSMMTAINERMESSVAAMTARTDNMMASITEHQTGMLRSQSEQREALREAEVQWQTSMGERTDKILSAINNYQSELLNSQTAQQASQQAAEANWQRRTGEATQQLIEALSAQLEALRTVETERAMVAGQKLTELANALTTQLLSLEAGLGQSFEQLQGNVAEQLMTLTTDMKASLEELVASTAEAPKAAAQLIEQLKVDTQRNLERDNELLSERQALMQELATLSEELRSSTALQQQVMDQVLEQSGQSLLQLSTNVGEQLGQCGEQLAGTALELSELGGNFSEAVVTFKASNEAMQGALTEVSAALAGAGERSDEQLAYYVAQAREIIDHNLMTQQVILEKLDAVAEKAGAENT